jgi:hypothetical protein
MKNFITVLSTEQNGEFKLILALLILNMKTYKKAIYIILMPPLFKIYIHFIISFDIIFRDEYH